MRVESRCNLRLGRAAPFVLGPFVVGAACGCAGPGNLLAALEGEDEGGPAFPVAFVCIETLAFFVFAAVPVGFDMIAICPKPCVSHQLRYLEGSPAPQVHAVVGILESALRSGPRIVEGERRRAR